MKKAYDLLLVHGSLSWLFLLAGIVGKWAGSAVFAKMGGLSWNDGNVLGVLMNCRGLLVLVVARLIPADPVAVIAGRHAAGANA